MDRYYFDLTRGNDVTLDEDGMDLATEGEVMQEAAEMMVAVAAGIARIDCHGRVSVAVHRQGEKPLYAGSLLFSVKKIGER